jgi:two-component system nitrogen regulation response regulator GlnG
MPILLAIDDDPLTLRCFRFAFGADTTVLTAASATEGLELFTENRPDAVICDLRLPDQSGMDVFRSMHELDPKVPVILATAHGTAETAIEAMRLGVFDYVVKPLDADKLERLVGRAFAISQLMRVPAVMGETNGHAPTGGDSLIGHCPAMQEVYKSIGRVAPQDVTVLIQGESGTGKELVARAVYHYSQRAACPFLAINCAAIPETLLESELFGHERGAFTGADRRRIGKFEQCSGGTLFLDEIGDMAPLTQAKILRVLQDQSFERVGGNETIRTDVRLIAATHRDLSGMMAEGKFRGDLYYRLNIYAIRLPPLRERLDDLPLLVDHFLHRFSQELHKEITTIAPAALELLRRNPWPGNVRELQSILKQALLRATGPILMPEFLPVSMLPETAEDTPFADVTQFVQERLQAGGAQIYDEVIARVERVLITESLRYTKDNLSYTSRLLGIARPTLRAKIQDLGLASEPVAKRQPATR